jgi:Holliday junction resolvase-like predicted endonuclease
MEDNQSGGNLIFVDGELVPVKIEPKYCINCKQKLPDSLIRRHAIYCSTYCRQEAARKETGTYYNDGQLLPSSVTGAIHELLVCAELMKKGYYVFRAQSPACPCDLVAMKDGDLFKIEVTTGRNSTSKLSFPKKKGSYLFDFMAIVLKDNSIRWRDRQYNEVEFP